VASVGYRSPSASSEVRETDGRHCPWTFAWTRHQTPVWSKLISMGALCCTGLPMWP